jgi:acyl-CoA thioesterase-2
MMQFHELFDLVDHGPDTYVGNGPRYPWGGLYGGHIVAQALRAASNTVEGDLLPHSLRAYFIRRGDHAETVRYEVDRIRNGRSFATRRVVARQSLGAILNLEASFQVHEDGPDVQTVAMPTDALPPDAFENTSWTTAFDRRFDPKSESSHVRMWMKATTDLGDEPLLHLCAVAYMSDDLPTDTVIRIHPKWPERRDVDEHTFFAASLDHAIWFHRPIRADQWHLYDMTCHNYTAGRGLSFGHVFTQDGMHAATIAQEVLVRDSLSRPAG